MPRHAPPEGSRAACSAVLQDPPRPVPPAHSSPLGPFGEAGQAMCQTRVRTRRFLRPWASIFCHHQHSPINNFHAQPPRTTPPNPPTEFSSPKAHPKAKNSLHKAITNVRKRQSTGVFVVIEER